MAIFYPVAAREYSGIIQTINAVDKHDGAGATTPRRAGETSLLTLSSVQSLALSLMAIVSGRGRWALESSPEGVSCTVYEIMRDGMAVPRRIVLHIGGFRSDVSSV